MHHTRIVVPGEAVAVLIALFSSTSRSQRLLEVLKIVVMDFYSFSLFL
jgi:hypothetical protein